MYIYIYIYIYISYTSLHFHARWGRRTGRGGREGEGGGRAQPVRDRVPLKAR